jgi:hypothetical protein
MVLARAAFESCVKAIWLVAVDDRFLGEARWLARVGEEAASWRREANLMKMLGFDEAERYAQVGDELDAFRLSIEARLPEGVKVPQPPNVRDILKEIGEERKYGYYIRLSQFSHSSHRAGGLYRRGLGSAKEFREVSDEAHWALAYAAAWPMFVGGADSILRAFGAETSAVPATLHADILEAIKALSRTES